MGVLIEVVKAPNQAERFLICVPANEYAGMKSLKWVTLVGACQRTGRDWTGKMSMALAQRVFDDMLARANSGQEAEWMKSIRVTQYRANTQKPAVVLLPREPEVVAVEPEVLPVAMATDGAWRVVPTTGFRKEFRGWSYQGAFVDSGNEGRTIRIAADTKQECALKLFGSISPVTQEFVRTFPLADPKAIPQPKGPTPEEYVPTQAELNSIPALSIEYCNSLSAAEMKRLFVFDWKFREGYRKRQILDAEADKRRAEIEKKRLENEFIAKTRKQILEGDAERARKGDL